MKFLSRNYVSLPLNETGSWNMSSSEKRTSGLLKKIFFSFFLAAIFVGSFKLCCLASDLKNPMVGFLIPKQEGMSEEASLVAGFEIFFKEKNLDPSIYFKKSEYSNTEESLLESLAELIKNPDVKAIVTPTDLRTAEQVVLGATVSEALIFVTNPAVRFVAGEMCRPNIIRVTPNTYVSSQPLTKWAFLNLGHKVFITGDNTIRGNEQGDFFALGMERIGGSFGDRWMIPADSKSYDQVFEKIEQSKPDFVFAAFSEETAPGFIKAYRSKGLDRKFPLIGTQSLTAYPEPVEKLKDLGLGIKTLCSILNPQEFRKKFAGQSSYPADLDMAAQGYDIANVFFSCLNGGCFDDSSQGKLASFIANLTIDGARGKTQFDGNREAIIPMSVCHWEQGPGGSLSLVVDERLEPCKSLDFGCGGVGFPDRPEVSSSEQNQGLWEEHHQ